jgi:hypothetical protein
VYSNFTLNYQNRKIKTLVFKNQQSPKTIEPIKVHRYNNMKPKNGDEKNGNTKVAVVTYWNW